MHSITAAFIALLAGTWSASAVAQTAQPPATTARTVIAATKLPSVVDEPLKFTALSITLAPGQQETVATFDGIVYQLAGTAEISVGGETTPLSTGGGAFIAGGKSVVLKATGTAPSTSLYFVLARDGVGQAMPTSGNVKELYSTAQPIAGLKPGRHDLNMTRVTFPAQMPSNPPHHRTGAALYYVISGAGANTVEGKTEMREAGTFIYEPGGLIHQWGNPNSTPLTFLTFNINQEGVPAVASDAPARSQ